ncbi:MAG TPA: glycosyltransferase family 4 protein [Candidatus Methylomirabilis sp.]|nr:glycosyltransferase family 4 protein [Candidatus Methylomirabilis sp.]
MAPGPASGLAAVTVYRIGFIVEQALSHALYGRNLQQHVSGDPDIHAHWELIAWETSGLLRHLPIYRSNWTVRAGLRARRAIARMTAQAQLDALFFHTQVPAVLSMRWVRRVPSIISLDATPLQYDTFGERYRHRVGPAWLEHVKRMVHRRCFRAARRLVAWSDWAKRGLTNEYDVPAEKISVIPPGVDVGAWARPTPRTRHTGPVKILFVGGDLKRKGGEVLLDVFRTVRPLGAELHLVTRDSVASEPGVFVYNRMEPNSMALRQLYHESDIFCLPTFADCLPLVLSEAGAAGLPLVATDVAGIREIVEDGVTGLLVPVGDARALAVALRALVTNPDLRLEHGARAAKVVAFKFNAQGSTRRLLGLLKRECAAAAAPHRNAT